MAHHHSVSAPTTSHISTQNGTTKEAVAGSDAKRLKISLDDSPHSSSNSLVHSDSTVESDVVATPKQSAPVNGTFTATDFPPLDVPKSNKRRASTLLLSQNDEDVQRLIGDQEPGTKLLEKVCCGGGCCFLDAKWTDENGENGENGAQSSDPIATPNNTAYKSLNLKLGPLTQDSELTNVASLPASTLSFAPVGSTEKVFKSLAEKNPPAFVTPHPPYSVFSAPLYHARELTKDGAEKRTYHFDLDVTDYPEEGGDVDFIVGGAIGICAPNSQESVDELFDLLGVPRTVRDRPVKLKTETGRWPTIWGEEQPRELTTTRRELLTWCSDLQSYPPTKFLLRLLAEHATAGHEKKILTYLVSGQGQGAFCEYGVLSHVYSSANSH